MARTFLNKENEKYVDRRAAVAGVEAVIGVEATDEVRYSAEDAFTGKVDYSDIGTVKVEAVAGVEPVAGRNAIVGVASQKERLAGNWEAMKRTDNVLGPVTVNRSYTTSVKNKYGTLGSIRSDGFDEKVQYQVGSNGEPNG